MESGVSTRLYEAWLQSKNKGSILFINPLVDASEQRTLLATVENFFGHTNDNSNTFLFSESSRGDSMVEETKDTRERKVEVDASFKNALAMLLELEALYITTTNQKLVKESDLQSTITSHLRYIDMTIG